MGIRNLKKYEKLTLYLIILGTLIRFLILLFVDVTAEPAWHVNVARFMATNLKIPLFEHLGRDVFWPASFFHILMAIFYKMFSVFGEGAAIFGAQLVTPILAGFTLLFNYLIVTRLFNKKIGFYSTLFLTFLPAHLYFSTLAYTDMALMLFVLAAIYFALEKRYLLSGLFSAIAMLTKYTGIVAILIIVPLMILQEKARIKGYLEYLGVALTIGSLWFVRNWLLLGNPVWRFSHNLFEGYSSSSVSGNAYSFLSLFSLKPLATLYAGVLGIPASNWNNLFYFDMPFLKIYLTIWLIGTALFLLPILFGIKELKKQGKILLIWLIPVILISVFTLYNIGGVFFRYLFPMLPIIGISWAYGFVKIKNSRIIIALLLIILGITSVEFAKAYGASKSIQKYQVDFDWIKHNTDKDAIFLIEGDQANSFYFDRYTYYSKEISELRDVDYVWINPTLPACCSYDEKSMEEIAKHDLVYANNVTKTMIYKVKK